MSMNLVKMGYSGAKVAKIQLDTVAMNVANSSNKSYTRQRADISALGPTGAMLSGSGVEVDRIRRLSDQFLIGQQRGATSLFSYHVTQNHYIKKLEKVISDKNTGLSEGMNKFFATLQEATTKPESIIIRQQVLNEAPSVANRFNFIEKTINEQREEVYRQQDTTIEMINSLVGSVAKLNRNITEAQAYDRNTNILQDERDEVVKQLSELIDVKVVHNNDGTYSLSLKNGQPLVSNNRSGILKISTIGKGERRLEMAFQKMSFTLDMNGIGSKLGSLHDYDAHILTPKQETVRSFAKEFTEKVNHILSNGFDLEGNYGKPLFSLEGENKINVTKISPRELALSSSADKKGNGDNLKQLLGIAEHQFNIAHKGLMRISDFTSNMVSQVGMEARNIENDLKAADEILHQVTIDRNNVSAPNKDEEAANLMEFSQIYQANLKVIATGDQLFSDLLAII